MSSRGPADELMHSVRSCPQLYPDGGLIWDGHIRCWVEADHEQPPLGETGKWAQDLWSLAQDLQSTGPRADEQAWKGIWLGGCCKTGPTEIRDLNSLLSGVYL